MRSDPRSWWYTERLYKPADVAEIQRQAKEAHVKREAQRNANRAWVISVADILDRDGRFPTGATRRGTTSRNRKRTALTISEEGMSGMLMELKQAREQNAILLEACKAGLARIESDIETPYLKTDDGNQLRTALSQASPQGEGANG